MVDERRLICPSGDDLRVPKKVRDTLGFEYVAILGCYRVKTHCPVAFGLEQRLIHNWTLFVIFIRGHQVQYLIEN